MPTDAATLRQLLVQARDRLRLLMQDRADAAGELRVNVLDCAPGTRTGKLLSANVILRHANGDLLGRVVDAERDRDIARTQLLVAVHLLEDAVAYLPDTPGARKAQVLTFLASLDKDHV